MKTKLITARLSLYKYIYNIMYSFLFCFLNDKIKRSLNVCDFNVWENSFVVLTYNIFNKII